jgi:hypothetical protein
MSDNVFGCRPDGRSQALVAFSLVWFTLYEAELWKKSPLAKLWRRNQNLGI